MFNNSTLGWEDTSVPFTQPIQCRPVAHLIRIAICIKVRGTMGVKVVPPLRQQRDMAAMFWQHGLLNREQ